MKKSWVRDGNYITIQSFMIKDLKLKGNELLTYAIIYGFSQNGESKFTGSLQYIADWTNSTKQGVMKNLKALVEKGLIVKTDIYENGVKFVKYHATEFNPMQQNLTGYETELNGGMQQSLTPPIQQSLPNNISSNNLSNSIRDNNSSADKTKRFVKPTLEEVKAYCAERGNNVDAEHFYDYYEANGWKVGKNPMKDWKASVRTWERNGYDGKAKTKKQTSGILEDYTRLQEKIDKGGLFGGTIN